MLFGGSGLPGKEYIRTYAKFIHVGCVSDSVTHHPPYLVSLRKSCKYNEALPLGMRSQAGAWERDYNEAEPLIMRSQAGAWERDYKQKSWVMLASFNATVMLNFSPDSALKRC